MTVLTVVCCSFLFSFSCLFFSQSGGQISINPSFVTLNLSFLPVSIETSFPLPPESAGWFCVPIFHSLLSHFIRNQNPTDLDTDPSHASRPNTGRFIVVFPNFSFSWSPEIDAYALP